MARRSVARHNNVTLRHSVGRARHTGLAVTGAGAGAGRGLTPPRGGTTRCRPGSRRSRTRSGRQTRWGCGCCRGRTSCEAGGGGGGGSARASAGVRTESPERSSRLAGVRPPVRPRCAAGRDYRIGGEGSQGGWLVLACSILGAGLQAPARSWARTSAPAPARGRCTQPPCLQICPKAWLRRAPEQVGGGGACGGRHAVVCAAGVLVAGCDLAAGHAAPGEERVPRGRVGWAASVGWAWRRLQVPMPDPESGPLLAASAALTEACRCRRRRWSRLQPRSTGRRLCSQLRRHRRTWRREASKRASAERGCKGRWRPDAFAARPARPQAQGGRPLTRRSGRHGRPPLRRRSRAAPRSSRQRPRTCGQQQVAGEVAWFWPDHTAAHGWGHPALSSAPPDSSHSHGDQALRHSRRLASAGVAGGAACRPAALGVGCAAGRAVINAPAQETGGHGALLS